MDKNRNYSREQKKEKLRRNMVETEKLRQQQENKKKKKLPKWKWKKPGWKITEWKKAALTVAAIALGGIFILLALYFSRYTTYKVSWSVEETNADTTVYTAFGEGGLVRASRDRAVFYDESGEVVWTVPYDMKNPQIVRKQDYLLIYDKQGQRLVICSKTGQEGMAETSLSITKGDVSSQGVVALIMEEENSSYISYYNKDGQKLDIDIKSPLATYGYPYDISISPDGQQLMASFYYISDGMGKSKVVFYDFESGQDVPDRTIGAFEDYEETNTMIPDVHYFSNQRAVAIGDNRLSFFQTNDQREQIRRTGDVTIEQEIQSVFYNESWLGVITKDSEQLWLSIYAPDGTEKQKRELDYSYKNVFFSDNYVVLYREDQWRLETFGGRVKFDGSFDEEVKAIIPAGMNRKYSLITTDQIQQILLK